MTTRWPWISMLVSLILTLSPLGRDIVDSAFFAGEALSRNIWAPIALTIFAVMGRRHSLGMADQNLHPQSPRPRRNDRLS
ncbi:hypothetical protein ABIF73_003263 [Bradyrhizobium japonicum]|uniref:hypothetical protein n=1 Tax=Bradyrhizobium japonicum TaxID=375 RepID=UPI003397246E